VQLFRASVRDNLTFFDRSISDEQIRHSSWTWRLVSLFAPRAGCGLIPAAALYRLESQLLASR
jgi:hypothetical protein